MPRPCYSHLLANKYKVSPLWCRAVCVLSKRLCNPAVARRLSKKVLSHNAEVHHTSLLTCAASRDPDPLCLWPAALVSVMLLCWVFICRPTRALSPQNMVARYKHPAVSPAPFPEHVLLSVHARHDMFVCAYDQRACKQFGPPDLPVKNVHRVRYIR